ncbi:MAG: hypothetical protein JNM61_12150 [Zoogloeaceae bacterium]|nr:hypothetical protein [Zoogloeaceae bacterium]
MRNYRTILLPPVAIAAALCMSPANAWKVRVGHWEAKGSTPQPIKEFDKKRIQILEAPGKVLKDAEKDAQKLGKSVNKLAIVAGKGLEHLAHETGRSVEKVTKYAADHPFETALFIAIAVTTGVVIADLANVYVLVSVEGAAVGVAVYEAAPQDKRDGGSERPTSESQGDKAASASTKGAKSAPDNATKDVPVEMSPITLIETKREDGLVIDSLDQQRLTSVMLEHLKQPSWNPSVQFNPQPGIPGSFNPLRSVLEMAVTEEAFGKIMSKALGDPQKHKLMEQVTSRYGMADQLISNYQEERTRRRGPLPEADRTDYIKKIGQLYDRNDVILHQYFDANIIKPGYKAGNVRARWALDAIDERMKDEEIRRKAQLVYDDIKKRPGSSPPWTKERVEKRIQELEKQYEDTSK